jgi:hypothetical protein
MYENGAGGEVDTVKAVSLYEQSKSAGSVRAGVRLVELNSP